MSVSVALCTYNGARYIEAQLESILMQTFLPSEVVVADDGSIDATLEIVRGVFGRHESSSVRLVVLESVGHLGVAGNFQRAIGATESQLVALCDQDDVWHNNRLAAVVGLFEADDQLSLVHGDARLIDGAGHAIGLSLFEALSLSEAERRDIAGGRAFEVFIRRNLVTGSTVVFRRSLMDAAFPFPSEWVHDEWLAVIAAATAGVTLVNEELVDYRQHGSNEIGVRRPTLRYRIGRMLEPRGQRYLRLAARSAALVDRLRSIDVANGVLELAERKAQFEKTRAGLPSVRIARLGAVLKARRDGSYSALSSQGNLDVLRDLLQPA